MVIAPTRKIRISQVLPKWYKSVCSMYSILPISAWVPCKGKFENPSTKWWLPGSNHVVNESSPNATPAHAKAIITSAGINLSIFNGCSSVMAR